MSARGVLRIIEGNRLGFWCPGCDEMHVIDSGWTFDGNYEAPTFCPSVLVTGRSFTSAGEAAYEAWCAAGYPKPAPSFESADTRCHSFVRAGRIEFLGDCTHAMVGQTVQLTAPQHFIE